MQLKEEHIKILKNVLRNDIAIEKEQLKRLEALKNKLNDKDFMEKLLSTNHFKQRLEELKLKEEILKVLEGNKEVFLDFLFFYKKWY